MSNSELDFEKLKEYFKADIYAMETTGIAIDEIGERYAKCSMKIEPKHMNAANSVQGGAIYTLADFTFAVAANTTAPTVSLSNSISYIKPAKGGTLYATAKLKSETKRMCFYDIEVTDDEGVLIATMSVTGYKTGK